MSRTASSPSLSTTGRQLIRYVMLGGCNAATGAAILAVLVLGFDLPYLAGHVIAHLVVVTIAFFPSSRWVFGRSVPTVSGLVRFHLSYAAHVAVSTGTLYALVRFDVLPLIPAQLAASGAAAVVSFTLQRTFVFRRRADTQTPNDQAREVVIL